MKRVARIIIVAVALAEGVGMTFFTSSLWGLGNAFGGSGDGAGSHGDPNGEMLATLIIAIVWLVLTSPYLCLAAGSLNLIAGKSLRVACVYSWVVLALLTLFEFRVFQRHYVFMAFGNLVAGGLSAYAFQGNSPAETGTPPV